MFLLALIVLRLTAVFIEPQAFAAPSNCFLDHARALVTHKTTRHPSVTIRGVPGFSVDNALRESIENEIAELAELAGTNKTIQLPSNLTIEVGAVSDLAEHNPGIIEIASSFKAVEYAKHPNATKVVLAHEWGHELLLVNLRERFPQVAARLEARSPADIAVFKAYNEVFADSVPVVWKKDGKIARTPIYSAAQSKSDNLAAMVRDFTAKHNVENWPYEGPYASLAPTRSFLWERYLSRPEVQKRSGDVFHALIEAIGNETTWRFQNPAIPLTPSQINERLILEIEKQMTGIGIL